MILVTGEELTKELRNELKIEVKGYMIKPCLAIIQVGSDELSSYFIEKKAKACSEVGIYLKHITFEENVTSKALATNREFLSINGNSEQCVTLKMFTKCPNCGYTFEHHQVIRYNK